MKNGENVDNLTPFSSLTESEQREKGRKGAFAKSYGAYYCADVK